MIAKIPKSEQQNHPARERYMYSSYYMNLKSIIWLQCDNWTGTNQEEQELEPQQKSIRYGFWLIHVAAHWFPWQCNEDFRHTSSVHAYLKWSVKHGLTHKEISTCHLYYSFQYTVFTLFNNVQFSTVKEYLKYTSHLYGLAWFGTDNSVEIVY